MLPQRQRQKPWSYAMPLDSPGTHELREIVRDVIRDALARRKPQGNVEFVRISSDEDLAAFVRSLLEKLKHPAAAASIRTGELVFRLAKNDRHVAPEDHGVQTSSSPGIVTGVITERKIDSFAAAGAIVLAPGAILTPLARDRARRLGLRIERSR